MAAKTIKSISMLLSEMKHLNQVEELVNYPLNLSTCLTTCVKNLHAVSHFKDATQTQLQYEGNLSNTVFEGLKRSVNWGAYYFTHPRSYYPVPNLSMKLVDLLEPRKPLTKEQQAAMLDWANSHGRCFHQRSARQETTMFKVCTLPLNIYQNGAVQGVSRVASSTCPITTAS